VQYPAAHLHLHGQCFRHFPEVSGRTDWIEYQFSAAAAPQIATPPTVAIPPPSGAFAVLACHLNLNGNDFTWFSYFYYVPFGLTWHTHTPIFGVISPSYSLILHTHPDAFLTLLKCIVNKALRGSRYFTVFAPNLPGRNSWSLAECNSLIVCGMWQTFVVFKWASHSGILQGTVWNQLIWAKQWFFKGYPITHESSYIRFH